MKARAYNTIKYDSMILVTLVLVTISTYLYYCVTTLLHCVLRPLIFIKVLAGLAIGFAR